VTPTDDEVLYEAIDGIAAITINRLEVHNALREQALRDLIVAFDRADNDRNVGAIELTGTGHQASSTGGDVDMEHGRASATHLCGTAHRC